MRIPFAAALATLTLAACKKDPDQMARVEWKTLCHTGGYEFSADGQLLFTGEIGDPLVNSTVLTRDALVKVGSEVVVKAWPTRVSVHPTMVVLTVDGFQQEMEYRVPADSTFLGVPVELRMIVPALNKWGEAQ